MAEEEEHTPVCECGDTHENDYYPEQCPNCKKWFVGQCASDNLIYTDDDDSVPCSCLDCDRDEEAAKAKRDEEEGEEGQEEGGVGAERLHEEEEEGQEEGGENLSEEK